MTNEQLIELLTLAFEKMTRYEVEYQAIFDEIASHPNRKMIDSISLKKIGTRSLPTLDGTFYEILKSALHS